MELKDIARKLPEEIWEVFEPLLPKVVWVGNGRPPCSNRDCLHGVLYVLVTGIPWVESHTTVNYNFFVSVGIGFPATDFNVFKHNAPRKG